NEIVGIAPRAQWIACRGFRNGYLVNGAVERCLQFFFAPTRQDGSGANPDLRPDIISHSYGIPDTVPLRRAFKALEHVGTIHVAAAGNIGDCRSIIWIPGSYESVLTVGATSRKSWQIAHFSSKGPSGELLKPNLAAPV